MQSFRPIAIDERLKILHVSDRHAVHTTSTVYDIVVSLRHRLGDATSLVYFITVEILDWGLKRKGRASTSRTCQWRE